MITTPIWRLYYLPDKKVISAGESIHVVIDLENPSAQHIYISNFEANVPWLSRAWRIQRSLMLSPKQRRNLVSLNLPVPNYVVGQRRIRFRLYTWQYDSNRRRWLPIKWISADPPMSVWTVRLPRYRAFISRSNHDYDRPVVDPIVAMIQQWGFETSTVGINIFEENRDKIPERILIEIVKADCLIGIATPRDLSALDGFWKTLTWLHSEVAMAFTMDKPIFVIADRSIKTEGIIAQKHPMKIYFSPFDLPKLCHELCYVMPGFREWIKSKRKARFSKALQEVVAGLAIGTFLVGVGYAIGRQQS